MSADRIEREIDIDAPIEVVWTVITEPEHITAGSPTRSSSTSARATRAVSAGTVKATDCRIVVNLRVERMEPPRFFSFRWNYPDGEEPTEANATLVEFSLEERGGSTRLRLVESGIDKLTRSDEDKETYFTGHTSGWATDRRAAPRLRPEAAGQRRPADARRGVETEALVAAVTEPTRRQLLDLLLDRGESTATVLADKPADQPAGRQQAPRSLYSCRARRKREERTRAALPPERRATRRSVAVTRRARRSSGTAAPAHQADRRGRSKGNDKRPVLAFGLRASRHVKQLRSGHGACPRAHPAPLPGGRARKSRISTRGKDCMYGGGRIRTSVG